MKYLKRLELFFESNNNSKSNTNLITDICVAMSIINPDFLNPILDEGRRSRYTHNTRVFLNDLRNLITANNRLKLGKFENGKYIEDDNIGKVNRFFNQYSDEFDMEKDWSKLSKSRDISRKITNSLLEDQKLDPSLVKNVYWVSPNKERGDRVDIIVETTDGRQYPLVINSKMNVTKTQSFNTLIDLMLDQQADKLFSDRYLSIWDKITQEWFKLIYDNSRHDIKIFIDQFIDASRADSLTYFDYFNIKIKDPEHQHLGKYSPSLRKNYKDLNKLMTDIWKEGDKNIDNFTVVEEKWNDIKRISLNNNIIEHLMSSSLENLIEGDGDIEYSEGNPNLIISNNKVKMRLMKVIVNLLNVDNIDNYYCTKDYIYHIPNRQWFRDNYGNLDVEYDYHQSLSEENDSQFKVILKINDKKLLHMNLFTGFSGGEMSGKLNTKMMVEYVSDWNNKVK